MTVTRESARELAVAELRRLFPAHAHELSIDDARTREEDVGWVFFWNSLRYLRDGDPEEGLVGNAPIVVDRAGTVHQTGTAAPIEDYLHKIRSAQD